jgi:SAM-dependent methyltransferase
LNPPNRQKKGQSQDGEPPTVRDLKRSRYETEDYGDRYDRRYCSGLNELNTLVERGWIARHLKGVFVLDAGTGTGRFAAFLENQGNRVVALDSSQAMLDSLREKAPCIPSLRSDIYELPFAENSFDAAVCMHVLFHLPDWPVVLAELGRVVKPGGAVFFEMRSGEHVRAAEKILQALRISLPSRGKADRSLATVYASRTEVLRAMESAGLELEKTLAYDLGHSYYLTPLAWMLERLYARFSWLRTAAGACELAFGSMLPAWFTYRTLYLARKK